MLGLTWNDPNCLTDGIPDRFFFLKKMQNFPELCSVDLYDIPHQDMHCLANKIVSYNMLILIPLNLDLSLFENTVDPDPPMFKYMLTT